MSYKARYLNSGALSR